MNLVEQIKAPFGSVQIQFTDGEVSGALLSTRAVAGKSSPLTDVGYRVKAYLLDSEDTFLDVSLKLQGTEKQTRLWNLMREIPPGETATYGELATELRSSPRAIGQACRVNPCPLIVPCHRVVAKNHIGGFMGKTNGGELNIKQWLLNHEKNTCPA